MRLEGWLQALRSFVWPSAPLPIFVISFNRGEFLKQVCRSYCMQDVPIRLIVHDNGSDDAHTLAVLDTLERKGIEIVRRDAIRHADELDMVDETVQAYCRREHYAGPYVVTDCDVDLSMAKPKALRIYLSLLDMFPDAECVGPMLRIDDIPRSYMLFQQATKRHIEQFWHRTPHMAQTEFGAVAVLEAPIDTTFALHRAGASFRRLKPGLRVYHPYEARHLDWYEHDAGTVYAKTSSPDISHWNNDRYTAEHTDLPHEALAYKIVQGSGTKLVVVDRTTAENPP